MKKEEQKINYRENLAQYYNIAKKYKFMFIFIIILVLIYEAIHMLEKYLFKLILDNGGEYVAGEITRELFLGFLFIAALIYISAVIIKSANHWIRISLINRLESYMMFDLKNRFFNHIVSLDHNFHTTHKTGALISRMNRGSGALERTSDFIVFNVAPLVLQIIIVTWAIFIFDVASAITILICSILFIAFGFMIARIQEKAQILANSAQDTEKANISDVFTNIDSIKYFGKEKFIKGRFKNLSEDTRDKLIRLWDYHRLFTMGESLILGIGTFFIIYFPLMKFLDGGISIGTLAFIYTSFTGLMGPLFGFVHGIRGFFISLGDFQDLFDYERVNNEIKDNANSRKINILNGEIEFNNISFKYRKGKSAINGLNLEINKNEKIALVGRSGCGKTTLVKLLYRFFDVDSGEIKIDGINIKDFQQESLRSELSIVPQEAILFDDTIYNNISFSNPSASREEIMRAIKFSQLDGLIKGLPKKENTIVGERGVKLSGGERQRVSIARAILANKKILVLDEATSALDSETEHQIQKDLEKLMEGRTSIIIAHRLSTIMKADKIVVMDKGKIVQIGKHRDLIKREGQYKRLWNLQKGGYIKE
ncbi:MAG: ABC transporter ATP-binding protein [Nanoarchaeota archaeon]|nr:ABC transporter ATP-binding protein [Nanoarchaeota archaeon]